MKHVVILGAGFSRFCSEQMPLTDQLGNEVANRVGGAMRMPPFRNGSFETWLSRLAEPQPYLNAETNMSNRSRFVAISKAVREVIVGAENVVTSSPPHEYLLRLVSVLHERRSTVATFNYDTLLERATEYRGLWDDERNADVGHEHVVEDRPPLPPASGVVFRRAVAKTFRLLKLHGSSDSFWVTGDSTGATINRLSCGTWSNRPNYEDQLRLQLPDRSPFIVPPAAAKSAFYANPHTRQLWQEVAQALVDAETVDVVGYSLPITDLVSVGLFAEYLAPASSNVRIVNPDAKQIAARLQSLGCSNERLTCIDGTEAVDQWIRLMEYETVPISPEAKDVKFALEQQARVAVSTSRYAPVACTDWRNEKGRMVLVLDQDDPGPERFNRKRGDGEPTPILLSSLLDAGAADRQIVVEYGSGRLAPILSSSPLPMGDQGAYGNWFQFIPSFSP